MMKIRFTPKTKDDWRLLLHLAQLIRLSTREQLAIVVDFWQASINKEQANVNQGR